jgi:hypothetical protein
MAEIKAKIGLTPKGAYSSYCNIRLLGLCYDSRRNVHE